MRYRIRLILVSLIVSVFLLLAYWKSSLWQKKEPKNTRRIQYTYIHQQTQNKYPFVDQQVPNAHMNSSVFKAAAAAGSGQDNLDPKSNGNLHVMILARMRTGSTLIGEIFNQNPDLFYLFEPLHTIDCYVRKRMITEDERMVRSRTLLRNLNDCQFAHTYVDCILMWGLGRYKSNVLRRVCESSYRCKAMTPSVLHKECMKYDNVFAMKMIRANLEMIRPMVTDDKMNIKIIHLIRDPRGTANSRKKYYNDMLNMHGGAANQYLNGGRPKSRTMRELGLLDQRPNLPYKVNNLESLCQWMRETAGMANDYPKWLRGRYKMVRYEDMANDPIRITRDIYKFVGLDLSNDILQWVRENTNTTNVTGWQTFSTHKNSSATASSWRRYLSYEEVSEVQNICGDVMSLLGYPLLEKAEDLANPDIPVTKPIKFRPDIVLT